MAGDAEIKIEDINFSCDMTEVPNVLFELGLSPTSVLIYLYLRCAVGGFGMFRKPRNVICYALNIAPSTYNKYRQELERPQHLLGGRKLITVTDKKKCEYKKITTPQIKFVTIGENLV